MGIKEKILRQIDKLLNVNADGTRETELWCSEENQESNAIWQLQNSYNLIDEEDKLRAAMRAILLFHWTKGKTIQEIKKETGFGDITKITAGDLERMAEVVSFHLDAIQKCLNTVAGKYRVFDTQAAANAFYDLQTRVKYGMPRDLVVFANKHIYGLDRSRLLAVKRDADDMSLTPVQYLYMASRQQLNRHLTPAQQTQLLQAMERRGAVREFNTLMEIAAKDAGTKLSPENADSLRRIAEWDGDPEQLYEDLDSLCRNVALQDTDISMRGSTKKVRWKIGEQSLYVGLPENADGTTDSDVEAFFRNNQEQPRLLLVPGSMETRNLNELKARYSCTALISSTFLAMILANTIMLGLDKGSCLFEFLSDARGVYTKTEYRYFSPMNYIRHNVDANTKPVFRVLCSSLSALRFSNLEVRLSKDQSLQNYEILPWGDQLNKYPDGFCDCPTVLLLERDQITHSISLTNFMTKMRGQNFENCLLLLGSEAARTTWIFQESLEGIGCNRWNNQLERIPMKVTQDETTAITEIDRFVRSWKKSTYLIGISYSHYDSQEMTVNLLEQVAGRLKENYGEHRILFDQFDPAKYLFNVRGQERSLEAYRKCKLNLILWNHNSLENVNCKKEREVIEAQCRDGKAERMYLKPSEPGTRVPDVPDPHFEVALTDGNINNIVISVEQELRKMGE